MAQTNNALRASVNGGRPPIAATTHPAVFTGQGVVPAHAPQGGGEHANPQYTAHAPSTPYASPAPYRGQPGAYPAHGPAAQPGHPVHGEAPGRR